MACISAVCFLHLAKSRPTKLLLRLMLSFELNRIDRNTAHTLCDIIGTLVVRCFFDEEKQSGSHAATMRLELVS